MRNFKSTVLSLALTITVAIHPAIDPRVLMDNAKKIIRDAGNKSVRLVQCAFRPVKYKCDPEMAETAEIYLKVAAPILIAAGSSIAGALSKTVYDLYMKGWVFNVSIGREGYSYPTTQIVVDKQFIYELIDNPNNTTIKQAVIDELNKLVEPSCSPSTVFTIHDNRGTGNSVTIERQSNCSFERKITGF